VAERPLLPLPTPSRQTRTKQSQQSFDPHGSLIRPSTARQGQRLAPKFERLREVSDQSLAQATLILQQDPEGLAPERALVFEVAGGLDDFYAQVQRVPGLEFLLQENVEFPPSDDFYLVHKRRGETLRSDASIGGKLYLAMPDLEALRQILSLWDRHQRGERMPRGFAPWGMLFELLVDLRTWGPQDRILPETVEYWRHRLQNDPITPIRFEIELWFFDQPERRQRTVAEVARLVQAAGGEVISQSEIAVIRYAGVLVDLPVASVEQILDNPRSGLGDASGIMYIQPQSIASLPNNEDLQTDELGGEDISSSANDLDPIVGLLDGMPVENHVLLRDRILVDDPEGFGSSSPVASRFHGTSMASLIIHGDLQALEPPLLRRLFIRPVLIYDAQAQAERTPANSLPLDIVYQAVRRILEGDALAPPTAPSVFVFNLSIGDVNRPFYGRISPWARLIDWLSFRYKVLFLVSAGNILGWLPVRNYLDRQAFQQADALEREKHILDALNMEKRNRTLLSPAEGLNALAVGAWHRDAYANPPTDFQATDPFPSGSLPNVSSAVGLGHLRIIKPDLLFDGGRELVRAAEDQGHIWIAPIPGGRYAGQLTAAPDDQGTGRLDRRVRTIGTSNATALLTRAAVLIYEGLVDSGYVIPPSHRAVVIKSLLIHGAEWGDTGKRLEDQFGPPGRAHLQRRENVTRFLGYGRPDIQRVLDCVAERATLFGFGELQVDTEDIFDIPLPPSIESTMHPRRLTITLTWLTPVNARHQSYRAAALEVFPAGDAEYSLAVGRRASQPTHHSVDRGTTFHCIYEGEEAVAFLDNGFLRLRVSCRTQLSSMDDSIPYSLAVSLETSIGTGVDIYQEVRQAIGLPLIAAAVSP